MSGAGRDDKNLGDLDELIGKITVDAYGGNEQLWAFRQAFEDAVPMTSDGFVIGEPVLVTRIDYDGNERRGLTARCRREDGSEHVVAASDVVFPEGSSGARYIAAYRKWLGLDHYPASAPGMSRRKRQHKATADDLDLNQTVELIVLSVKERAARCRLAGRDRVITLRATRLWDLVPGEIVTVKPRKLWSYARHPYLSGDIESSRLEVRALGLVPLRLEPMGTWDPEEHYWGDEDEPVEEWAKPIIARGPRVERTLRNRPAVGILEPVRVCLLEHRPQRDRRAAAYLLRLVAAAQEREQRLDQFVVADRKVTCELSGQQEIGG